jgi:hypothetical protein
MHAVLGKLYPKSRRTTMNFIEWTQEQESTKPIPSNLKTIKTKQERDRLTRMEAKLDELVLLKRIILEARTFQPSENSHASTN